MWYIVKKENGEHIVTSHSSDGEVVYYHAHLHIVRDKLDQMELAGELVGNACVVVPWKNKT
ncbi:MAG: hypothetical protein GY743_23010 [Planctomycetaceae bacterium]|nr:hypothetical protein [Planctomycetaceae bacterium]